MKFKSLTLAMSFFYFASCGSLFEKKDNSVDVPSGRPGLPTYQEAYKWLKENGLTNKSAESHLTIWHLDFNQDGFKLKDEDFKYLAAICNRSPVLTISFAAQTEFTGGAFSQINETCDLWKIETFDLSKTTLKSEDLSDKLSLFKIKNFNISDSTVDGNVLKNNDLSRLTKFFAENTSISDSDLEYLKSNNKSLEKLNVINTTVTLNGLKTFIKDNESLKNISIASNLITSSDAIALIADKGEELIVSLKGYSLSDQKKIVESAKCQKIIGLNGTGFKDSGLTELLDSLTQAECIDTVSEMDVSNNELTTESLTALSGIKNLTKVYWESGSENIANLKLEQKVIDSFNKTRKDNGLKTVKFEVSDEL